MDDRIEYFMRLCELERETLNRRREIEWKVCISFWSAIIVGTGFLMIQKKVELCSYNFWFYLSLFIIFSIFWLGTMFHSNEFNHYRISEYRSHIHKALGIQFDDVIYKKPKWYACITRFWWWCQMLITLLFLLASWCLLNVKIVAECK